MVQYRLNPVLKKMYSIDFQKIIKTEKKIAPDLKGFRK